MSGRPGIDPQRYNRETPLSNQVLKSGSMRPKRYIVNFFDEPKSGKLDFDGCAQLWMSSYEEYRAQVKNSQPRNVEWRND